LFFPGIRYCEDDFVYVTFFPKAVFGLFAKQQFKTDDILTYYTGTLVDSQLAKQLDPTFQLFITKFGMFCQGDKEKPGSFVKGCDLNPKLVNARFDMNNIQIVEMEIQIPLIATRDIEAHEEVISSNRVVSNWLRTEKVYKVIFYNKDFRIVNLATLSSTG